MFSFLSRPPRRRKVICIGLDGVPYTVIRSLIDRGVMPHLASICRTGALAPMDTTIPDISSVAWSSFMTGVNPGQHGLYGFYDLHPQSYRFRFPRFTDLNSPPIWDLMPEKKTCAFNIPSTYPARKINGLMVSGFVAPDLEKSVYPAALLDELRRINYRTDADTSLAKTDSAALAPGTAGFIAELLVTARQHRQVMLDLLRRKDWDLFIGVMTATDRLQHFFMDAYADERHDHHDLFMNVYRDVDETLGEIFAEKDEDTLLVILSDHGFCCLEKEVNLNVLLRDQGYLRTGGDERDPGTTGLAPGTAGFTDLRSETRAFCLTPGRIYLHYQDTYSRGSVKRTDGGKIIEDLIGLFTGLDDNGKKVIQSIHRRDDLYHGPYREIAPDLVLMPVPGYDLKGGLGPRTIFTDSHFHGMHTQDDAMLFVSKRIKKNRPQILDVTATIAGYLSCPAEMDGDNLL